MVASNPQAVQRTEVLSLFGAFAGVLFFFLPLTLHAQTPAPSGTVLTIAGIGSFGYSGDGGPATNASLSSPYGLAIGPDGTLYIADAGNESVRAITSATGIIKTIAGNGNADCDGHGSGDGGPATNASFCGLISVAVDRGRNALYFSDTGNNRVRKVSLTNGILSNFAGVGISYPYQTIGLRGDGGPAIGAWFSGEPVSVAVDGAGNTYIAEGCRIRKVDAATGIIHTIAGKPDPATGGMSDITETTGDGGPATNATFYFPQSVAADGAGNVFIIDISGNVPNTTNYVRRIDAVTGIITRVAGGGTNTPGTGPATNMNLTGSVALAVDQAGTVLYIAGGANNSSVPRVFKVDLASDELGPYAGTEVAGFSGDGGPAADARFDGIAGLTVAPGGGLVISDSINQRVRYVAPDSINLTNDSQQTEFHLPWVSELVGDLVVANNTNLAIVDLGSLATTGGNVSIVDNTDASVVNIGSLGTSGGIEISGNTSASAVNIGSLVASGGNVSIDDNTSASVINIGSLGTSGGIEISGNGDATNIDLDSLATLNGNLTITSNAPGAKVSLNSLTSFGGGTNDVTMTVDGTLMVTNGLTIDTNATLAGNATVDGSVTNNGTISPGNSPGHFDIHGRLVLTDTSKLKLQLGGYAPSQFDFVNVTGGVMLGGTLSVSLIDDFPGVMTNGASFTLLTAGSPLVNAFANVADGATLTTTDGYARFTVHYAGGNQLLLTGLAIVDSDNDGLPDWWEDQFGLNKGNSADALLDLDGDGASNLNEFLAGTNPTNSASVFRLIGVQLETNAVRIFWSTVGGRSYRVQTNGSLVDNFADFSQLITTSGDGEAMTNFVDTAAVTNATTRYYRVRLGP